MDGLELGNACLSAEVNFEITGYRWTTCVCSTDLCKRQWVAWRTMITTYRTDPAAQRFHERYADCRFWPEQKHVFELGVPLKKGRFEELVIVVLDQAAKERKGNMETT